MALQLLIIFIISDYLTLFVADDGTMLLRPRLVISSQLPQTWSIPIFITILIFILITISISSSHLASHVVTPFQSTACMPIPIQWDVPGRIAELQTMINDPATNESQKINLQIAINLYHAKELPGRFKWIHDGKVVRHKDIDFRRPYWVEVFPFASHDLSTKYTYPHFNLGLWPATILTGYGSSYHARAVFCTRYRERRRSYFV